MADAFFLKESDRATLAAMLAEFRARTRNTTGRPGFNETDQLPPEVYVALTPSGGIPRLRESELDTGTAYGSGDIPGSAVCDIYRLLDDGGTKRLSRAGFTRRVYNLSSGDLADHSWVKINRDKFGQWYADTGGGSGSTTVYETDPRCEGGSLNVYERPVVIQLAGGSLTRIPGAWAFSHGAGCCTCETTGTGTSCCFTMRNLTDYRYICVAMTSEDGTVLTSTLKFSGNPNDGSQWTWIWTEYSGECPSNPDRQPGLRVRPFLLNNDVDACVSGLELLTSETIDVFNLVEGCTAPPQAAFNLSISGTTSFGSVCWGLSSGETIHVAVEMRWTNDADDCPTVPCCQDPPAVVCLTVREDPTLDSTLTANMSSFVGSFLLLLQSDGVNYHSAELNCGSSTFRWNVECNGTQLLLSLTETSGNVPTVEGTSDSFICPPFTASGIASLTNGAVPCSGVGGHTYLASWTVSDDFTTCGGDIGTGTGPGTGTQDECLSDLFVGFPGCCPESCLPLNLCLLLISDDVNFNLMSVTLSYGGGEWQGFSTWPGGTPYSLEWKLQCGSGVPGGEWQLFYRFATVGDGTSDTIVASSTICEPFAVKGSFTVPGDSVIGPGALVCWSVFNCTHASPYDCLTTTGTSTSTSSGGGGGTVSFTECCNGYSIPTTLHLSLSGTGWTGVGPSSVTLTYGVLGSGGAWQSADITFHGSTVRFIFGCTGGSPFTPNSGSWQFYMTCGGVDVATSVVNPVSGVTCDPFSVSAFSMPVGMDNACLNGWVTSLSCAIVE